jgi:hypothetical protein
MGLLDVFSTLDFGTLASSFLGFAGPSFSRSKGASVAGAEGPFAWWEIGDRDLGLGRGGTDTDIGTA